VRAAGGASRWTGRQIYVQSTNILFAYAVIPHLWTAPPYRGSHAGKPTI